MKRVSDTLLGTIERIVFGRSQSHTIPLLKREEFQLLPTNDEVTTSFLTSSSDGKSMELKVNSLPTYDCDPITLEELTDEIFVFRYDSKSPGIKYNITSILTSIASSKQLVDPVTRLPLKPRDINLLDRKAIKLGLTPATLSCRRKRKEQQQEMKTKQITSNLEVILGGFVSELLALIESKEAQYQVDSLISVVVSEFTQPFNEYKDLNLEAAYMALSSWKTFLRGSPRRPTSSANGRLKSVIDFLSSLWKPQDQELLLALRSSNCD